MTSSINLTITSGPSKFDLAVALFDENQQQGARIVEFYTDKGNFTAVIIGCADTAAPLREIWELSGFVWPTGDKDRNTSRAFKARFSTKTRKGAMEFSK